MNQDIKKTLGDIMRIDPKLNGSTRAALVESFLCDLEIRAYNRGRKAALESVKADIDAHWKPTT